jgi:uncharacterized membrane protein YfcA
LVSVDAYILYTLLISVLAGLIGSLVGIGGGILVVPVLTLLFGVPIQYAIGASIVSVIATSSGSASAYVRDRITNLRVGMFLEIATTSGAIIGAVLTLFLVHSGLSWIVYTVFGIVLIYSGYDILKRRNKSDTVVNQTPDKLSNYLNLKGSYYDSALKKEIVYAATRVPAGMGIMFCAGMLSGLLGIGSGALKVLGMDTMMKLPFKVSTTTSNFMIGVTAAASTGIFFIGGYVNPILAAPVAIGVVIGSFFGTKVLVRTRPSSLRLLFVAVLAVLGIEMIRNGIVLSHALGAL